MSRSFWYYFVTGFIFLILSLETAPMISIYGQMPDLVLIFLVFLAQKKGPMKGIFIGFILGLFIDFFSGQLMGAQAFIKMTIGLFSGLIGIRIIIYSFQMEILFIFFSSIFQAIVLYIFLVLFANVSTNAYFSTVWIGVLYTTLSAFFVLLLLNLIDRKSFERI